MQERFIYATPQAAIRRHVEAARDWEWHAVASTLYQWTDRFNMAFFEAGMPDAVLSFERLDVRILAAYTLKRNTEGLLYEIVFNTCHLGRPTWQTLETLLHEYVHLWQQNYGEHPVQRNYHNVEFVGKCEALGLHPAIGLGVHLKPADGRFAELLTKHGLERPPDTADVTLDKRGKPLDWWYPEGGRERKGRSTLSKWTCGCQNVRVGTKEFYACCTRCGHAFTNVESGKTPPTASEEQARKASGSVEPPDEDARGCAEGVSGP